MTDREGRAPLAGRRMQTRWQQSARPGSLCSKALLVAAALLAGCVGAGKPCSDSAPCPAGYACTAGACALCDPAAPPVPTLTCAPATTVECTGGGRATVVLGYTEQLGCGLPAITDTIGPTAYPMGLTSVTFTSREGGKNPVTCTTDVVVQDTTPPTIRCPAPLVVECTGNRTAFVAPGAATATDACETPTITGPGTGAYPLGLTGTSYRASDSSGNAAFCVSTIEVRDTQPPQITCPAPLVVECTGNRTAFVAPGAATATDSCETPTITGPGTAAYPLGLTATSYRASDSSGNTASCASTIEVQDTSAPVVTAGPAGGPAKALWPASAELVTIDLLADCQLAAQDTCDGAIALGAGNVEAGCVTSNEALADAGGADVVFLDATHVQLWARSSGGGAGRIYRIPLTVKDASGNKTTAVCRVDVGAGPAFPSDDGAVAQTVCPGAPQCSGSSCGTPSVTSTTPADAATDVQATSAITASFSEAMTAATLTTATFTLSGGVSGAVTYDAANNRATFTPSAPLAAQTAYTATITTGAKDLAGNGLAAAHTWTFTTAAPHLGAVFLPKTGQVLCYGTGASATVQNCSGTAQDGELRKGVAWPVPRFTDNLDGTITDHLTGLQWLKDANCLDTNYPSYDAASNGGGHGLATWASALAFVAGINAGTYPLCGAGTTGWRLPNINELASLSGTGRDQSLDLMNAPIGFTHVQSGFGYWSSTTSAWPYMFGNDPPYYAWALSFLSSIPDSIAQKDSVRWVWPVRDGPSTPAAAAPLPATGQTVSYAAGDDGALRKGVAWPTTRFVASSSGAGVVMTDMLTGLIWTQDTNAPGPAECNPAALKTWAQAFTYVACLNAGAYLGRTDWRLPNKTELRSLYAFGEIQNDQWLAVQGFTNVSSSTSDYYWTSTTNESSAGNAWFIGLIVGRDDDTSFDKATQLKVWPVAGG